MKAELNIKQGQRKKPEEEAVVVVVIRFNKFISPLLLAVLFLLTSFRNSDKGESPDPVKDLALIYQAYSQAESLEIVASYTLYQNGGSHNSLENKSEKMYRKGKVLYREQGNIILVQDEKHLISLDNKRKLIIVTNSYPSNSIISAAGIPMDSLTRYYDYIQNGPVSEGDENTLVMGLFSGQFQKLELTYNRKTFFITRMKMFFRKEVMLPGGTQADKPVVEIKYRQQTSLRQENEALLNPGSYVVFNGASPACAPAYKTYKLVNNILKR